MADQYLELVDKAALARRTYDSAMEVVQNPPLDGNYGISFDWSWGSSFSVTGKMALRNKIKAQVEASFRDMMNIALSELAQEDAEAHEALALYLRDNPK